MRTTTAGCLIALGLLAGCAEQPTTKVKNDPEAATGGYAAAVAARDAVVRDQSSPDLTLKTIWAVQDADRTVRCAGLDQIRSDPTFGPIYDDVVDEIAPRGLVTGAMARYVADRLGECTVPKYARDILEVKVESESRAVVTARVRNITPIPEGAEVDDWDRRARKDGDTYRYIMAKGEEGWQLEEVWTLDDIIEDRELYDPDSPPYVPTLTDAL